MDNLTEGEKDFGEILEEAKETEVGSRLRLPSSIHKRFKKKLIDDGLSIQEFYRRAVDRYLSKGEE